MRNFKDVLLSIAIGVMVGVIIFEVIFAIHLYQSAGDNQNLNVKIESGEEEVVEFDALGLLPGQSTEYNLYLTTNDGPTKSVRLEFREKEDSPLADFVRVQIFANDEEICDELLADLMSGGDVILDGDLTAAEEFKITIVYYMPEEVGNEAANTEAWFDIYVSAQFK